MRILQVLLSPRIGGAETLAASLQECWQEKGIEAKTAYIDPIDSTNISRINRIRNVRTAYDSFHPDIVLSHSALPNAYCRLALPRSVIVVPVLHSSADDYSARSLRYLERLFQLWRNDSIVAVSKLAMSRYVNRFPKHPEICIIRNGVSDPGYVAHPVPIASRVSTLARVASMKNPWLWKKVVDHYEENRAQLRFDWIGPIESRPDVRALVSSHERTASISHFVGPMDNAASALRKYDVYFHPSDREAFGIALVEAAMAGLPIVASESVAEAVGPNLVAHTFRPGDVESAIRAIDDVVDNYAFYKASSLERRNFALAKYDIKDTAISYEILFTKILIKARSNAFRDSFN